MSELAKEVDYFHVKVKLCVIVVVQVLIDNLIHITLSIVYKVGYVGLGYLVVIGLCKVKSVKRFIFHVFSVS